MGWAMADHMRAELACDALSMALDARRPQPGLIFHADRGTQYTSAEYRGLLDVNGIDPSFSRLGQCWDNAVIESWFSTLKTELIDGRSWATRAQARRAVFEFIEVFYNRQRLIPPGLPQPGRVRSQQGPPPRGRSGGIVRLSGEAGQSHEPPILRSASRSCGPRR